MIRCFLAAISILFLSISVNAEQILAADPNAVFPVEKISVATKAGQFQFSVEIADEPHERQRGLMHREEMLQTHGMLFDFKKRQRVEMWMRNTPMSLDMVFIRKNGSVARIARSTTPFSLNIVSSKEPVSYVLELKAGMARLIGLEPGDVFEYEGFNTAN